MCQAQPTSGNGGAARSGQEMDELQSRKCIIWCTWVYIIIEAALHTAFGLSAIH
jgi:hypothetical protein